MVKLSALFTTSLLILFNATTSLSSSSAPDEPQRQIRAIATEEEALLVRRRLQTVNEDVIDAITQTASDVDVDPVLGPWPQCIGMQSDDCIAFIEALAADVYSVVVLPIELEKTRVWVHVDKEGKVNKVPYRG